MFLLLSPALARAHGGPPSALGIVAADNAGQPSLVLLNEGLAFADGDHWSFLCPRLWGDPDTSSGKSPLAGSIDGVESWIIGADDLYSARAGVLTPQARPDLSSAAIVALAADDDALFGLRVTGDGSAIVRIDDAAKAPVFTSPEFWSSLAAFDRRLYIARFSSDGEVVRATLDRDGQVLEEHVHATGGALVQIRLRPTARGLFAVTFDGMGYTLATIDQASWQVLEQSVAPIRGPQASANGALWIALDGGLMRQAEPGGAFEAVSEARPVTCLENHRGRFAYACAGSELYRLDDGGLGARLFQLDHLGEPDPVLVPEAAARDCGFQWLLYRNDLERTGLSPRDLADADDDAGAAAGDAGAAARDAAAPSPARDDAGAAAPGPPDTGSCDCRAVAAHAGITLLQSASLAGFAAWIAARTRARSRRRRCPAYC